MQKHIKFILTISTCWLLINQHLFAATQIKEHLSPDVLSTMQSNVIDPIEPHLIFPNDRQAQIWLSQMSKRLTKWVPDQFLRDRYLTIIQYEASRAALDPQLILSIITVESRFNKYAISNKGARGMMQVMPFWQQQIGNPSQDLFDVETNLRYGCTILRYYLQREHGDMDRALARYNGSIGQSWYPKLVNDANNKYWHLEQNGSI